MHGRTTVCTVKELTTESRLKNDCGSASICPDAHAKHIHTHTPLTHNLASTRAHTPSHTPAQTRARTKHTHTHPEEGGGHTKTHAHAHAHAHAHGHTLAPSHTTAQARAHLSKKTLGHTTKGDPLAARSVGLSRCNLSRRRIHSVDSKRPSATQALSWGSASSARSRAEVAVLAYRAPTCHTSKVPH